MNETPAREIAFGALVWLARQPEALGHFLAATGGDVEMVRARADDAEFLGFVLDHILMDDASVAEAARHVGCAPESLMRARQALPGGAVPDWT